MKSKKKFLLLGVGVMGALALGVGATSTFAWYTATGAKNITTVAGATEAISTSATAVGLDNLYLVVSAADQGAVAMTTSDGETYGIVNNKLVKSNQTNTLFQVAQLSIDVYTTWTDKVHGDTPKDNAIQLDELSGDPSAEDIGRITPTSVTLSVSAGARTRVANYATGKTLTSKSDFASLSWAFEGHVEITINIDKTKSDVATAFLFATNNDKVFYSVSGEAAGTDQDSTYVDGKISAGSGWNVDGTLPSGSISVGPQIS